MAAAGYLPTEERQPCGEKRTLSPSRLSQCETLVSKASVPSNSHSNSVSHTSQGASRHEPLHDASERTIEEEERARSAVEWFSKTGNQSLDLRNGEARAFPSGVSANSTMSPPRGTQNDEKASWYHSTTWFRFLAMLGLGASVLSFLVDEACNRISLVKVSILQGTPEYEFATWIAFQLGVVFVARLCVCGCPLAEGSGVPEVKAELSGSKLVRYFSPRVLLSKLFGLSLARGGGLPLGKEGPFVHMSACLAHAMLHIPCFDKAHLGNTHDVRRILLTASVAVGTGATFGAPIGGVLFALETMPEVVWRNKSYWSCLAATITGAFCYRLLESVSVGTPSALKPVIHTNMARFGDKIAEDPLRDSYLMVLYVALGGICGVMGALFVRAHERVAKIFNDFRIGDGSGGGWRNISDPLVAPGDSPWLSRSGKSVVAPSVCLGLEEPMISKPHSDDGRAYVFHGPCVSSNARFQVRSMLLCLGVTFVNATLTFAIPLLRTPSQSELIGKLMSIDALHISESYDPRLMFFLCLLIKLLTTVISLVLPLPTGCIAPVYIIGCLVGRFFGHLVAPWFGLEDDPAFVARFALIGCTAFAAGVCRSFSIVVAVFESVSLPTALLPLCASALVSIWSANAMHVPSIFDAVLQRKHLPAVQMLTAHHRGLLPVSQVARKGIVSLCLEPTIDDVRLALKSRNNFFPVMQVATKARPRLETDWSHCGSPTVPRRRTTVTSPIGNRSSFLIGAVSRHALRDLYAQRVDSVAHYSRIAEVDSHYGSCDGGSRNELLDLEECEDGHVRGLITPLVVKPTMSVQDVFFLLDFHRVPCAFVSSGGHMVGIVSVHDLLDAKPCT